MKLVALTLSYLCLILAVLHLGPLLQGKKYGGYGVLVHMYAFILLRVVFSNRFLNLLTGTVVNIYLKYNISPKIVFWGIIFIIIIIYLLLFVPYFVFYEKARAKSNLKWWKTLWRFP